MKTWPCRIAIILLLIGNATGCSGDKRKADKSTGFVLDDIASSEQAIDGKAKEAGGKAAPNAPQAKAVERKIIYTATLRLQVEDFGKAEDELLLLVEEHKGLLEMSNIEARPGASRSGQWRVRIPPENLSGFRKAAAKLGEPEQNNLDSKEVTEEFYDVIEQIKNKDKELESYRRLFEQAKGIPEIVSVKRELDRVQSELDRLKGRHKVLENLTGLATVTVWLWERGAYTPEESADFGTSAGRTFSGSLGALIKFGRGVALVCVALAPWLPVLLVVILPLFFWLRRLRRSAALPSPIPVLDSSTPAGDR
jgi:hypothetical protein